MTQLGRTAMALMVFTLAGGGKAADEGAKSTQRLLLLLPAGPLVMDVAATIDGEPFGAMRQRMIDEMLRGADENQDGRITWAEALEAPRFAAGKFLRQTRDDASRRKFIARYDANGDGLVQRGEVRRLVASLAGGEAFAVSRLDSSDRDRIPPVLPVLDTDGDGSLSAEELANASRRLKTLDVDDNDILVPAELSGRPLGFAAGAFAPGPPESMRRDSSRSPILFPLGPNANWAGLLAELKRRYGKDGRLVPTSFLAPRGLFERLDADRDGALDATDLHGLADMPPHVALEVNLGRVGKLAAGVALKSLSPRLGDRKEIVSTREKTIHLALPSAGVLLKSENITPWYDYEAQVRSRFARFDRNGDGVLELSEAFGASPGRNVWRFRRWDLDRDEKVARDEMTQALRLEQQLPWSGVSAALIDGGNHLFATVDITGDGVLSAREIHYAARRLKALDITGDGRVSRQEIARSLRLILDRAAYDIPDTPPAPVDPKKPATKQPMPQRPTPPKWFLRMDRNRDGDISRREFLGTDEQFRRLDRNGDAFIEPKEAAPR